MDQNQMDQIKKINSNIDCLGIFSFLLAILITLIKITGNYYCADFIVIVLQILTTCGLFYIFYKLLKCHDENQDGTKYNYGATVLLFSKIDSINLLERIISVVSADILLFISKEEIFVDPWKTILFWLILGDLIIWFFLKKVELDNQRYNFLKYLLICLLISLISLSLLAPVLLFWNLIKGYYMIGLFLIVFVFVFFIFQNKEKKN